MRAFQLDADTHRLLDALPRNVLVQLRRLRVSPHDHPVDRRNALRNEAAEGVGVARRDQIAGHRRVALVRLPPAAGAHR